MKFFALLNIFIYEIDNLIKKHYYYEKINFQVLF